MTQPAKYQKSLLLVFGLISMVFLVVYRHNLNAPDTFNYLFIAEELIKGQFYDAISGHWGMLGPILLAPLLALGIEGVLAFKILNWLVGLVLFSLFLNLLGRLNLGNWIYWISAIVVMPVIINMSMMLTSDLLMITFGFWYFSLVSDPLFFDSEKACRKAGLAGGFMYLSKGYGLPFFLAHFLVLHLAVFLFRKRLGIPVNGKILKTYFRGLLTFFLVALPLVLALSVKFGGFTISTAGKYNLALSGPERSGLQVTKNELVDPGTKYTKLWAYEEPATFVNAWSPFGSQEAFSIYQKQLSINAWSIYYIPMIRDLGFIFALLVGGILLWRINLDPLERYLLLSSLLAVLIFTGGYGLLIVRPRYLWFDFLLLMPMVWLSLKIISSKVNLDIVRFWTVCVGVLVLVNTYDEFGYRTAHKAFFEQLVKTEQQIPDELLKGKNVAIIDIPKEQHLMEADAYLWYKKRFKFLGQPFAETILEEGLSPLKAFPVDYFMLWQHDDLAETVFRYEEIVFEDEILDLKIYKLSD
ncbi:MAG: hypothetical protein AAF502_08340 [Bacteroidota bacterium]